MTAGGTTSSAQASGDAGATLQTCAPVLQPIVRFGVSGHRDPADPDEAKRMVADALSSVLATLDSARRGGRTLRLAPPPADKLACQVVSPLAEGADRIVASMIACDDARLSVRARELVVPLPFPLDCYRGTDGHPGSDCRDAESQRQFDDLYQVACWTQSLHAHAPVTDRQRDAWYRDVGKFVVEHSDLLIALWDGYDNGLDAGTAAIVRMALQRGALVIWVPITRRTKPDQDVPSRHLDAPRLLLPAGQPRGRAAGDGRA